MATRSVQHMTSRLFIGMPNTTDNIRFDSVTAAGDHANMTGNVSFDSVTVAGDYAEHDRQYQL